MLKCNNNVQILTNTKSGKTAAAIYAVAAYMSKGNDEIGKQITVAMVESFENRLKNIEEGFLDPDTALTPSKVMNYSAKCQSLPLSTIAYMFLTKRDNLSFDTKERSFISLNWNVGKMAWNKLMEAEDDNDDVVRPILVDGVPKFVGTMSDDYEHRGEELKDLSLVEFYALFVTCDKKTKRKGYRVPMLPDHPTESTKPRVAIMLEEVRMVNLAPTMRIPKFDDNPEMYAKIMSYYFVPRRSIATWKGRNAVEILGQWEGSLEGQPWTLGRWMKHNIDKLLKCNYEFEIITNPGDGVHCPEEMEVDVEEEEYEDLFGGTDLDRLVYQEELQHNPLPSNKESLATALSMRSNNVKIFGNQRTARRVEDDSFLLDDVDGKLTAELKRHMKSLEEQFITARVDGDRKYPWNTMYDYLETRNLESIQYTCAANALMHFEEFERCRMAMTLEQGRNGQDRPLFAGEVMERYGVKQQVIFVTGKAGTGKSKVLHAILDYIAIRGCLSRVAVTSSLGSSASLLYGGTIHSLVGWSMEWARNKVGTPNAKTINKIRNLDVLVLDEIGMVSTGLFGQINFVLQHATQRNQHFGGIPLVILGGDFYQLRPIDRGAKPLFYRAEMDALRARRKFGGSGRGRGEESDVVEMEETVQDDAGGIEILGQSNFAANGQVIWNTCITQMYELKKQFRFSAESAEFLERICTGNGTAEDLQVFQDKILNNDPMSPYYKTKWEDATFIVRFNDLRYHINREAATAFAKKTGHPIYVVASVDNRKDLTPEQIVAMMEMPECKKTSYLPGMLFFVPGMPIVLKQNVLANVGLSNNAICEAYGLVMHEEDKERVKDCRPGEFFFPVHKIKAVLVKMRDDESTNIRKPSLPKAQHLPEGVVPVFRKSGTVEVPGQFEEPQLQRKRKRGAGKNKGQNARVVARRQFPLTPGFAVTVQCAQGMTHKGKLVAEIATFAGDQNGTLATYVAASRTTDFVNNFAVLGTVNPSCVTGKWNNRETQANKDSHLRCIEKEMERIRNHESYVKVTPALVNMVKASMKEYSLYVDISVANQLENQTGMLVIDSERATDSEDE